MTFAEWQAQQGGGAGTPSPGGVPSFADWQAQTGGGSPPGAAPPPSDHGTQGAEPLRGILQNPYPVDKDPNSNYETDLPITTSANWGKTFDPSERYGAFGNFRAFDVPSGRGEGGWTAKDKDLWYYDPKYGAITPKSNLIDPSYEKDWRDYVGPLVMAAVLGGAGLAAGAAEGAAAAGAGGGAAGAGSGAAGAGTLAGAEGAALGGAQAVQGALTNPSGAGGALGGAAGSYFGGPIGGIAGSAAGQALQHGPENVNWGGVAGSAAGQYLKTPGLGTAGGYLYNAAKGKPVTAAGMIAPASSIFAQWLASQGGK